MNYLLAAPTNGQNPSMLTEFERVRKKFGLALLLIGICFSLEATAFQTIQSYSSQGSPSWELVEMWRMGDSEDDDVQFGYIHDVEVDSKGITYVVNFKYPAIQTFSETGIFLREIGRPGQGPGEFNEVHSVYVDDADTVFVWDWVEQRITVFSPDDYHVVDVVQVPWGPRTTFPSVFIGAAPEAHGFGYGYPIRDGIDIQATRGLDIYWVDRQQGLAPDQMPLTELPDMSALYDERRDGSFKLWWKPFEGRIESNMSKQGLLYLAQGDSSFIALSSADRTVQDTIRWHHDPIPVTPIDIEDVERGKPRRWKRVMRNAGYSETKPAFQNFVVDDLNRVWIQPSAAYGQTMITWLILDSKGAQVATVDLPANIELRAVRDDRAYGVLRTDDGVKVLIAYDIQRAE